MQQLALSQISNAYLKPVSFEVSPGEICCLLGESGSGKSLLLRTIADLDPHEGEISLGEYQQKETIPHRWRRMVGLLPADPAWWFDSIEEHFDLSSSDQKTLDFMITSLSLDPRQLKKNPEDLSSGEKTRWGIIRLLLLKPKVLLLDEPTANLDEANSLAVEKLVTNFIKEYQTPAIWVTHNPAQANRLSSYHIVMENGEIKEKRH